MLPEEGRDLILAGAIISILLNPLLFAALDVFLTQREGREKAIADAAAASEAEGGRGRDADARANPPDEV